MERQYTDRQPRIWNAVLGVWLFISAFLWPHSRWEFNNAWIVGLLVVVFSLIALRAPAARYVNTLLSVWLFVTVWFAPRVSVATVWNHALVGIAIFVLSLIGGRGARPTQELPSPSEVRGRRQRAPHDEQPRV